MTDELRTDLLCIVLEEAFCMRESYARKLLTGAGDRRFNKADGDALEGAHNVVNRIEARCGRIDG